MRQFFITVAGVFVGLVLSVIILSIGVVGLIGGLFEPEKTALPDNIVVELDLTQPIVEQPAQGLAALDPTSQPVSIFNLVRGLEHAAQDSRVKGVLIRVGAGVVTPAQAEEIHEAIMPVREAGKFIYAFSISFNGSTLGDYDVATAADEIWLQPSGVFMPAGYAVEGLFVKGLLDKIGAKGEFIALHEYKTAADMFTRSGFSEADREQIGQLLSSMHTSAIERMSGARSLPSDDVMAALANSPQGSADAKSGGLIDELGYEDELRAQIRDVSGEDARIVSLSEYASGLSGKESDDKIAVIFGEGVVVEGESEGSGLFGSEAIMAGDTVSDAFRDAVEDPDVKAIVFRVNSPGGSATASDQIWRAIVKASEKGKPIIVSLGDVAASGGYYVAVAGDYVVADAATITGSIGVVGGKFVFDALADKIGVQSDSIAQNDTALMWTPTRSFSEEERQRLRELLTHTYDDFTDRVMQGRALTDAEINDVARGRVWSGQDAKAKGLVDEIGGFRKAVSLARAQGGFEEDAEVILQIFPKPQSLFGGFFESAHEFEEVQNTLKWLVAARSGSLGRMIDEMHAQDAAVGSKGADVLRAPPIEVK